MPSHCIPTHLVTTGFAFNLGVIVCIDPIPITQIVFLPCESYSFMVQLIIHFTSLPALDARFVSLLQSIVSKILFDVVIIIDVLTLASATLDIFIRLLLSAFFCHPLLICNSCPMFKNKKLLVHFTSPRRIPCNTQHNTSNLIKKNEDGYRPPFHRYESY